MKFGVAVALLSLFLVTISANEEDGGDTDGDHDVSKCHLLIDKLLEKLKNLLKTLDPFYLPNISLGLDVKMLFEEALANFTLKNGYIKGLSSFSKIVDCTVERKGDMEYYQVNISAGPIEINYEGFVKLLFLEQSFKVNIKLLHIHVTIKFDPKSKFLEIKLNKINILDAKVSGMGVLSYLLKPLIQALQPLLQKVMETALINIIKLSFEEITETF